MKAMRSAALAIIILLTACVRPVEPIARPERTIPGMTAEQARDQIVQWCGARGANIDQAATNEVTCSGLPVVLASAPATSGAGSPRRYRLQAMIDAQRGGVHVTAWPYTEQPSESDMPADQRREVQAMLDDLHPGAADTGPAAQPVAPPAARPEGDAPGHASELIGVASVTDGDTIEIHGTAIRLSGFDAPEHGRRCGAVNVGQQSALALSDFIGTRTVHCALTGARTHRRYVATCTVDDFVGVQTYTRVVARRDGGFGPEAGHPLTVMGYEDRPQALAQTCRFAWDRIKTPIIVTENGWAGDDDRRRIAFVQEALAGLHRAIADGIDVRGYYYWSLFDNFEWLAGYGPKFGLIAVDRATQQRRIKPSAVAFGEIARSNAVNPTEPLRTGQSPTVSNDGSPVGLGANDP